MEGGLSSGWEMENLNIKEDKDAYSYLYLN